MRCENETDTVETLIARFEINSLARQSQNRQNAGRYWRPADVAVFRSCCFKEHRRDADATMHIDAEIFQRYPSIASNR